MHEIAESMIRRTISELFGLKNVRKFHKITPQDTFKFKGRYIANLKKKQERRIKFAGAIAGFSEDIVGTAKNLNGLACKNDASDSL